MLSASIQINEVNSQFIRQQLTADKIEDIYAFYLVSLVLKRLICIKMGVIYIYFAEETVTNLDAICTSNRKKKSVLQHD